MRCNAINDVVFLPRANSTTIKRIGLRHNNYTVSRYLRDGYRKSKTTWSNWHRKVHRFYDLEDLLIFFARPFIFETGPRRSLSFWNKKQSVCTRFDDTCKWPFWRGDEVGNRGKSATLFDVIRNVPTNTINYYVRASTCSSKSPNDKTIVVRRRRFYLSIAVGTGRGENFVLTIRYNLYCIRIFFSP